MVFISIFDIGIHARVMVIVNATVVTMISCVVTIISISIAVLDKRTLKPVHTRTGLLLGNPNSVTIMKKVAATV